MSWRTVIISKRCKLDLNMGYMVIRGEDTKRVFINEIAILVLESPAISITGALLSALSKNKTRIIFCDEKRSPYGELEPYYGSHDSSRKIREQISWSDEQKGLVWTRIVTEKIYNQARFLNDLGRTREYELLLSYVDEIEFCDVTNREGHAAKVYFNAIFGMDFSRGQDSPINAALNYGYGIILSAVNREVSINGYSSKIGLFHDNVFNPYNLSCDLMEPFRVIIDRQAVNMEMSDFGTEQKREIVSVLNEQYLIGGTRQILLNAIKIYVKSVFDAITNKDPSMIKFAII